MGAFERFDLKLFQKKKKIPEEFGII